MNLNLHAMMKDSSHSSTYPRYDANDNQSQLFDYCPGKKPWGQTCLRAKLLSYSNKECFERIKGTFSILFFQQPNYWTEAVEAHHVADVQSWKTMDIKKFQATQLHPIIVILCKCDVWFPPCWLSPGCFERRVSCHGTANVGPWIMQLATWLLIFNGQWWPAVRLVLLSTSTSHSCDAQGKWDDGLTSLKNCWH